MNKSEKNAKQLNQVIIARLKERVKLIVAIDGYAGTGKTTIANHLKLLNRQVEVVHLDDFIKHWKIRKHLIDSAKDKSKVFEYDWYRYRELEKLIRSFKKHRTGKSLQKVYDYKLNEYSAKPKAFSLSKKILVVDGIFLLHPKHKLNQLFDFTVYLDADTNRADKRRMAREQAEFGDKFLPDNHPDNWFRYFKQAYLRYMKKYRPQKRASLVFKV